ncbi:hypothetical protein JQK15_13540 [Sphingobium sp. BHU LFT2]|uniref:hypothetical protein n=1 Tax=Sphingobium sp. BHU LFT2 TaxID=2807634 RepID=UPI001BE78673|nr:hypothetical protein [Sphingobium sp. BHU LFT2]MBT2244562.1 hypothetical protein [Sphingobium sp. BHU LFT2]
MVKLEKFLRITSNILFIPALAQMIAAIGWGHENRLFIDLWFWLWAASLCLKTDILEKALTAAKQLADRQRIAADRVAENAARFQNWQSRQINELKSELKSRPAPVWQYDLQAPDALTADEEACYGAAVDAVYRGHFVSDMRRREAMLDRKFVEHAPTSYTLIDARHPSTITGEYLDAIRSDAIAARGGKWSEILFPDRQSAEAFRDKWDIAGLVIGTAADQSAREYLASAVDNIIAPVKVQEGRA